MTINPTEYVDMSHDSSSRALRLAPGRALFAGWVCLVTIGCGSPSPPSSESAPQVIGEARGTLLASVSTPGGRRFDFREIGEGSTAVDEAGPIGQKGLLSENISGRTLAEIFRMLQPDAEVPSALIEADARFFAAHAKGAPLPPLAPTEMTKPAEGAAVKFYNAGEQAWFKSTFCNASDVVDCLQGWDWANTAWHLGNFYSSVALVNSEGRTGTFTVYDWTCNGSCSQTVGYTVQVAPGYWQSRYVWNVWPQWHISDLRNGVAQVSLTAQVDSASVRGIQDASNYLTVHGDNWWGESRVQLYVDGIPGRTNGVQYALGGANITNNQFDWNGIVTCIPVGSARNPVTIRAVGTFGETVVQNNFVMVGCW